MKKEIRSVPQEERWSYRDLLLLADPEERAVRRYLMESDMYVLFANGKPVTEAVVRTEDDGGCELMNLATAEAEQGKGYAGELIRYLMKVYAASCRTMLVGTSEDGVPFYKRHGFEPAFIRKNFFLDNYEEPIIENERRCVDMYCLRANLKRE